MIPCATLHLLDGTPVSVSPHEVVDVQPTPDGCLITVPGRVLAVREFAVAVRAALDAAAGAPSGIVTR